MSFQVTRSSPSVDGDAVAPWIRRERLSSPPSPALLEPEAGQPSHQVHLTRPDVARDDRVEADAVPRQDDVDLLERLLHRIVARGVARDESDVESWGVGVLA